MRRKFSAELIKKIQQGQQAPCWILYSCSTAVELTPQNLEVVGLILAWFKFFFQRILKKNI